MNTSQTYDVIVIGSGPGGFSAAMRASELGMHACVIEKGSPGGVCVNEGCIPTKSLASQAGSFNCRSELSRMGVHVDTAGFTYQPVYEQSRKAAALVSKGIRFQLDRHHIDLYEETAAILSPTDVSLSGGSVISGKNIVIAAGSLPRELPGFDIDESVVLSSTGVLHLTELPSSMLIIGGGYIGCEYAYIMNAFGVDVTVVEMTGRILPGMDSDIVAVLARSFRRKGITVKINTRTTGMERTGDGARVTVENPDGTSVINAEKVMISVGRVPNTGNIGLESVGLKAEKGGIPTGEYYRTAIPTIYAIGDIAGEPMLAHNASRQGEIAAEAIAGVPTEKRIDPLRIPAAVFTDPPLAAFGLTGDAAKDRNIPYKPVSTHYRGSGKAVADNRTDGLMKILLDPDGNTLLGASIIGESAPEIIHVLLLAATAGIPPDTIGQMIHVHPTFSEMVREVMGRLGE